MGCMGKKDKSQLIKIVKNKENVITIDTTGKLEGRGAYICKDKDCLKKAMKIRRLDKSFKTRISDEVYDEISTVIDNNE